MSSTEGEPAFPGVTLMLTVPGWTGSGPGHWMSIWEAADPSMKRVSQADWDDPDPEQWVAELEAVVGRAEGQVVLIAHSCGVSTVQRWAHADERRVVCAVLVAPPDPDQPAAPDEVGRFGPMSATPLPFRTLVVASRTDPNCSFERAALFAGHWGAELVDAGDAGHLITASGHGAWPEGEALVRGFLRKCADPGVDVS